MQTFRLKMHFGKKKIWFFNLIFLCAVYNASTLSFRTNAEFNRKGDLSTELSIINGIELTLFIYVSSMLTLYVLELFVICRTFLTNRGRH